MLMRDNYQLRRFTADLKKEYEALNFREADLLNHLVIRILEMHFADELQLIGKVKKVN
jgi:hypothetical protein